jgi:hypothetical protein
LGEASHAAGDLEAVEEQAGAVNVELVGGEALDDFVESALERDAVVGEGDGEALPSGWWW